MRTILILIGLVQARRTGPSDAEREAAAQGVPFAILAQSWAFDRSLVAAVRHLVKEEAAALVQTHGYRTHLLGFLLKRNAGLPWVGFEHGWTAENWRIRLYHRLDWLLRYADAVVAVSSARRHLRGMSVSSSRLTRIVNPVESDEGWSACARGQFKEPMCP